MTADQTDVFSADEGDHWFRRNVASLKVSHDSDHVIALLSRWNEREAVRSVCDLGCSNGWRLAAIAELMPGVDRLAGSDLSSAAIDDGRQRWSQLELAVGTLDRPGLTGPFDVVIVSFVFHWVARERLAASLAAIDELLRDGGVLIIADFLPDQPCARAYHHRTDVEIYTYKQDYARCFTGLGTYEEVERKAFAHSGNSGSAMDPQDRAVAVLLRKDLAAYRRD
ncbi:MAG TPA: class I SAM-dependent methyltransferase [Polyangiaceae bacterium]|jgi:SAM-dependent methyltransferase|nr:class I SAM-dependent methyltransferase [Polyangiaceae bacterium]